VQAVLNRCEKQLPSAFGTRFFSRGVSGGHRECGDAPNSNPHATSSRASATRFLCAPHSPARSHSATRCAESPRLSRHSRARESRCAPRRKKRRRPRDSARLCDSRFRSRTRTDSPRFAHLAASSESTTFSGGVGKPPADSTVVIEPAIFAAPAGPPDGSFFSVAQALHIKTDPMAGRVIENSRLDRAGRARNRAFTAASPQSFN